MGGEGCENGGEKKREMETEMNEEATWGFAGEQFQVAVDKTQTGNCNMVAQAQVEY